MYLTLLENSTKIVVTEGMNEVSEYETEMAVEDALLIANKFNIGKYHPDVYINFKWCGKELQQIVKGNEIIGFAEQE